MKILIVDDEPLNRALLLHMLDTEGYKDCFEAANGEAALLIAEQVQPDLVLLDVLMPGMNGYQVAPRLKAKRSDSYLPVIFITSLDDKQSLIQCLEAGGDDFVTKPFDKLLLVAKIRAHERIRSLSKRFDDQNQELRFFQQNVDREHRIVEHIFANAFANNAKVSRYFDYRLSPADAFNGDVFLCEASPSGGIYYLIGDFTGHGLASAIGALPVSRAFQSMATKGISVGEMAYTVNEMLLTILPADMFFAATLVEVSSDGSRATVWNGGMPPMLIKADAGTLLRRVLPRHMALGILTAAEFDSECEIVSVEHGDQLFSYTDGLPETEDPQGKMLGEQGVEEWFMSSSDITTEALNRKISDYRAQPENADDLTMVIFSVTQLQPLRQPEDMGALPFTIHIRLNSGELKRPQALSSLLDMINSQPGFTWIRSELFTVMNELYSNALEHGVLGLNSAIKKTPEGFMTYYERRDKKLSALQQGYVDITVGYLPDLREIHITITDSGDGFDYTKLLKPHEESSSGRGLLLIHQMCKEVRHFDEGRSVSVVLGT